MADTLHVGGAVLFGAAFVGLLVAEHRRSVAGMAVFKPLASLLFVALAVVEGASATTGGRWILLGLVFSLVGDVFLVPRDSALAFRVALFAFLAAHVAYVVAFLAIGVGPQATAVVGLAVLLPVAVLVVLWLEHHVPKPMWGPVLAYIVVISVMLAAAAGTFATGATVWILGGAFAFYLSDITVARDRFVVRAFANRMVGLPLYYGGQLALAWSVGRL